MSPKEAILQAWSRKRKSTCFLLILLPLLLGLTWPISRIGSAYRAVLCRWVNRAIMNSTHTSDVVRLVEDPRPGHDWHAVAALWNQDSHSVGATFDVNIHQTNYLPTAVFVALMVAGKFAWGTRFLVMKVLFGVLLFQMRGLLPLVALERAVNGTAHAGPLDLLISLVDRSLVSPLGMAFALPFLLWFGLCRRDLLRAKCPLPFGRTRSVSGR